MSIDSYGRMINGQTEHSLRGTGGRYVFLCIKPQSLNGAEEYRQQECSRFKTGLVSQTFCMVSQNDQSNICIILPVLLKLSILL